MSDSLRKEIDALKAVNILVLGDVMLDRYVIGNVERISPEAPVGVLQADEYQVRPGGAASVAAFAAALGANVSIAGVIGNDPDGVTLNNLCRDAGISTTLVVTDPDRITTRKERFIGRASGRHEHQMLRVDHECTTPINDAVEFRLLECLRVVPVDFDAVLIADYAKGVCSDSLLQAAISFATDRGIPLIVDPGKGRPLEIYRGATVIKPNRREASEAIGKPVCHIDEAQTAAKEIRLRCGAEHVVVTLDHDGCVIDGTGGTHHLSTEQRDVYDICGAGDMFLAMLGIGLANGQSVQTAAKLANHSAGLEVEHLGTSPITLEEVRESCRTGKPSSASKQIRVEQLPDLLSTYRSAARRIVFTNGCFDLLHIGHVSYLQEAATLGDVLVVAINSDDGVRGHKGLGRPIVDEHSRAAMLCSLECVDHVVVFEEDTPRHLLEMIRPDVLVKGGTTEDIVGRRFVEGYGGRVVRTKTVGHVSTSSTIERISMSEASQNQKKVGYGD
ncbi:MAG: PfkB family carbohydrate kinase [Fuerstiella sp.]